MATGLHGYPHFKNSEAAMKSYEPLYQNLFLVELTGLPKAMASNHVTDRDLVLQNVTKIGGLQSDQTPKPVVQRYKGHARSYAGALPDQTFTDLKLNLHINLRDPKGSNDAYVYTFFRNWSDLIWNPLTGGMLTKEDYICDALTVTWYNKIGSAFKRTKYRYVFISEKLNVPELDYTTGEKIFDLEVSLRADFWDEGNKGL